MNEFGWSSEAASQKVAGTGIHLTCMSGQTSLRGTEGSPIWTGKSGGNEFVLGELELSPVCWFLWIWFGAVECGCWHLILLCWSTEWKFLYPAVKGMDNLAENFPHLGQWFSNFNLLSSFAKKTWRQWSWHKNPHREQMINVWGGMDAAGKAPKKHGEYDWMEHSAATLWSRKASWSKEGGGLECNCWMSSLWVNQAWDKRRLMKPQEDARKMMCLHVSQLSGQLQKTPRGFVEIK